MPGASLHSAPITSSSVASCSGVALVCLAILIVGAGTSDDGRRGGSAVGGLRTVDADIEQAEVVDDMQKAWRQKREDGGKAN